MTEKTPIIHHIAVSDAVTDDEVPAVLLRIFAADHHGQAESAPILSGSFLWGDFLQTLVLWNQYATERMAGNLPPGFPDPFDRKH